jgi:hypothetical protein
MGNPQVGLYNNLDNYNNYNNNKNNNKNHSDCYEYNYNYLKFCRLVLVSVR